MPLSIDPEFVAGLESLLPVLGDPVTFPPGDVLSRRANVNRRWALAMETWPVIDDVEHSIHTSRSSIDGAEIATHRYVKAGSSPSKSAVVYTHGGGYFCLNVPLYHNVLQTYVSQSGVQFFAVEYRFAPEHPFPTPVEDSYSGLLWVNQHASAFGIDPTRIAIMGDSAGGGVAAGVAIMARDRELSPPLAKQLIIGGMIDDRNVSRWEALTPFATWAPDDNLTGWWTYIGRDKAGKDDVSPYAAASRVESVQGLAPLYLDVPGLDIFRDENIRYAQRFAAADIATELHLYPSLPHSFEAFTPQIQAAKVAMANRVRAIQLL
ncbi:hypothetical protein LTR10_018233 [Elasticomyces elasticus]|uniref:Alpha/beta hydrolase fold-3 domain-containing protein n=1 Tax=Exophiala sideris TaxID=1016849 RepID=A0ABR0JIT7_9EURO|nr:hypothetical protein LTR10_018233 [Elasticomyces elasticus]KAK5034526.1 hypothetical protein LTS07_003447 [Exophiala sideris]KAK5042822.1 hypothetical protein LTR13_001670 [Exophiala sideris]KAK5065905.1 hypothetical protein LTR69_003455 [Exophiala sideris]KAK5185634.1 hypothetical protein LTR44_001683 [Eurotiomycetes sp. CCFEE 6388]